MMFINIPTDDWKHIFQKETHFTNSELKERKNGQIMVSVFCGCWFEPDSK